MLTSRRLLKILMFGWEFPPFNSGGLGVACENLAKSLANQGIKIIFVLPKKINCQPSFCKLVFADEPSAEESFLRIKVKAVNSLLSPYLAPKSYQSLFRKDKEQSIYSPDLFGEVARYAEEAKGIALSETFDVIHAHDWLSFPAGLFAKEVSGKPLVVHIHATEFDRTGGSNVNHYIYKIEKEGLEKSDAVIAVSDFTKNKIVEHYGIKQEKIKVVHNAVEQKAPCLSKKDFFGLKKRGKKIVLFVGRITLQKGPDYFLKAAKKVLEHNPDVFFVIAGSGDMEIQIIETAAELGIADKVLFAGFLRGDDLAKIYQAADLYVLPSVSEPFGITPLESLAQGTPVLISKQSGVSEVLSHCLKVDFWNINEMADKILAVLKHKELHQQLQENGSQEVKKISWQDSARKCIKVYSEILNPILEIKN